MQFVAMQQQTWRWFVLVKRVANDWLTDAGKVDANLVGPTSF